VIICKIALRKPGYFLSKCGERVESDKRKVKMWTPGGALNREGGSNQWGHVTCSDCLATKDKPIDFIAHPIVHKVNTRRRVRTIACGADITKLTPGRKGNARYQWKRVTCPDCRRDLEIGES
jgi:hypothetical protein